MALDASLLSQIANPQPINIPNPVTTAMTGLQLKNAMQQNQAGQLQLQQTQQQMDRQQRIYSTISDWVGQGKSVEDPGLVDAMYEVDPEIATGLAQHQAQMAQSRMSTVKTAQDIQDKQAEDRKALFSGLLNSSDAVLPAAVRATSSRMAQLGMSPDSIPSDDSSAQQMYGMSLRDWLKSQGGAQSFEKLGPGDGLVPTGNPGAGPVVTMPMKPDLEQKNVLLNGKPTNVNFDHTTGRTFDPGTGQDISGQTIPIPGEAERELAGFLQQQKSDPKLQRYAPNAFGLDQWKADNSVAGRIQVVNATNTAQTGKLPALANVPSHLLPQASADYSKAGEEYAAAAQGADDIQAFIGLAKKGNVVAYSYAPTEGVLTLNTDQGVKRLNFGQIASSGSAGSALDQLEGYFGKQLSGRSIPDNILNDMAQVQTAIAQNAKTTYQRKVQNINASYGAQYDPLEFGSTTAPAATPQKAPQIGSVVTVRGKQVKITAIHPDGTFDAVDVGGKP